MNKSYFLFVAVLFVAVLFVAGCSSRNEQTLQCNEVNYIQTFPVEVSLDKIEPLSLDLIGCVDMEPADSLIIFKVLDGEYFWRIYSLNSNTFITELLPRGHSNMEFVDLPYSESILQTDSALYCDFCDDARRRLLRCNLTRTLEQGKLDIEHIFDYKKYERLRSAISLSDTLIYMKTGIGIGGNTRFMLSNDKKQELTNIGNLNAVQIKKDPNTLSAVTRINRKRMMAVEAMLRLNQINVYSLQSDSSLTICVGKKLSNVRKMDACPEQLRHEYYGNVMTYDDYFVALYYDTSIMDYIQGNGKSSLQFFDWNGNPLLCIHLPITATSFYISQDRYLYVFSTMEVKETLYKYDCAELFKSTIMCTHR